MTKAFTVQTTQMSYPSCHMDTPLEAWVSRCRLENHGRNQMGPPRGDATHSDGNLPYPRLIGWLSFRFLGLASSSASKEPVTQLGSEQLSEGAGPIATYTQI